MSHDEDAPLTPEELLAYMEPLRHQIRLVALLARSNHRVRNAALVQAHAAGWRWDQLSAVLGVSQAHAVMIVREETR
jgi:hypothetical protein